MKIDNYYLSARIYPTLLALLPFFTFHYFFLTPVLGSFWGNLMSITVVSNITFSVVLFFLLLQLGRYVAKKVYEEIIYKNGLYFPTTNYLLHTDSMLPSEYKTQVHNKINKDFGILTPSVKAEQLDELNSRKIIIQAVGRMQASVKVGRLVGQHNAEYGFSRNFAGCSILASIMSLVDIYLFSVIFPLDSAFWISLVSLFIYGTYTFLSPWIIRNFGNSYAKVLIQEYMSS